MTEAAYLHHPVEDMEPIELEPISREAEAVRRVALALHGDGRSIVATMARVVEFLEQLNIEHDYDLNELPASNQAVNETRRKLRAELRDGSIARKLDQKGRTGQRRNGKRARRRRA